MRELDQDFLGASPRRAFVRTPLDVAISAYLATRSAQIRKRSSRVLRA